jgi:hypothetical protein
MGTHIYITSALLFFSLFHTSSTLLGRPAGPDPSRLAQEGCYTVRNVEHWSSVLEVVVWFTLLYVEG